jgi:VWFA-related protein
MRISLACLLALPLLLTSALAAQPPASAPEFGEVVEVDVVNVEAFVTDRSGNAVSGLRREDFQLFEDGKPVEVTYFSAVENPPAGVPGAAPAEPAPPGGEPAARPEAAPPADPLHLVVYVDNFNLQPANRARALDQIGEFLGRLAPEDRVLLVSSDLRLNVRQPFTTDRAALAKGLESMKSLATHGREADQTRRTALQTIIHLHELGIAQGDPCTAEVASPAQGYAEGRRQEVLRTIAALKVLVNSLSGIPGRKALLHVSDGIPVTPGEELFQVLFELCGGGSATGAPPGVATLDANMLGPGAYQAQAALLDAQRYSTARDFEALAAHANAQRVTFYTLQAGLAGNAAASAEFAGNERILQLTSVTSIEIANRQNALFALANGTGGRAILDANQFVQDLARMRADFDSYYSLGYSPRNAGDGREHRIEVKVKGKGLRVRHRQSYRAKPPLERSVDRVLAAAFHGVEDNPLDVSIEVGEQVPGPDKSWAVPVRLKIPLFKLTVFKDKEGAFAGRLRLLVATRGHEDGTLSPVRQVEVPISIPRNEVLTAMGQYFVYTLTLNLQPGEQTVAVGVRDEPSRIASYLSRDVKVGKAASPRSDSR